MDYLWTPWRYQYITTAGKPAECIFCAAARATDDREPLVVHRGQRNFVILNRYPYTSGHVMIVPYQHAPSLEALDDETLGELIRLARESETHLRAIYQPEGLNLGINIGKSAGAGVVGHVHMHALPRWTGDTAFMTTVGETRLLPEDLEVTWQKLRRAWSPETRA
jgi:ATP adenylyltransferase